VPADEVGLPAEMTRRSMLTRAASLIARAAKGGTDDEPYDRIVRPQFQSANLVGLEACAIEDGSPVWTNGCGFADVEHRIPMTADTIINLASVSKTVTACAVMQLYEQRLLGLDEDVSGYVPFAVRNPLHASIPITVRQLLAHTSSLADGPAYAQSYTCGDSTFGLRDWLSEYVLPQGRYYSPQNFHSWPPGQRFQYSNLGFGLLGYAVEAVSGVPFRTYCRNKIFRPLGMRYSSFGAVKDPAQRAAIPYTIAPQGKPLDRVVQNGTAVPVKWNGASYLPSCLYTFPNYPDGLVRTSAREFSRFVSAIVCEGEFEGHRVVQPATLGEMFREQFPKAFRPPSWPAVQGLAWYAIRAPDSNLIWLHTGADPGIRTVVMCYPSRKSAVLLFANTAPAEGLTDLAGACLRQAVRSSTARTKLR